jgi:hypothetical protein
MKGEKLLDECLAHAAKLSDTGNEIERLEREQQELKERFIPGSVIYLPYSINSLSTGYPFTPDSLNISLFFAELVHSEATIEPEIEINKLDLSMPKRMYPDTPVPSYPYTKDFIESVTSHPHTKEIIDYITSNKWGYAVSEYIKDNFNATYVHYSVVAWFSLDCVSFLHDWLNGESK